MEKPRCSETSPFLSFVPLCSDTLIWFLALTHFLSEVADVTWQIRAPPPPFFIIIFLKLSLKLTWIILSCVFLVHCEWKCCIWRLTEQPPGQSTPVLILAFHRLKSKATSCLCLFSATLEQALLLKHTLTLKQWGRIWLSLVISRSFFYTLIRVLCFSLS